MTRLAVAFILVFLSGAMAADAPGDIEMRESRPLGKVLGKVSHLYGYLVTYEEAQYDEGSELAVDVYSNGKRYRYPAWKPITFRLTARQPDGSAVSGSPAPLGLVESLVDQYNSSGNPGRFAAVSDGEYIHVVPAGRTKDGKIGYFQPILDTVVASDPQPDRCARVMDNLLQQVGRLRGVEIVLGIAPMNPLISFQCAIRGTGLTAREALKQILQQMGVLSGDYDGNRWTWNFCYDANVAEYFLNLDLVPQGVVYRYLYPGIASPAPDSGKAAKERESQPPAAEPHPQIVVRPHISGANDGAFHDPTVP